jgi:hypothetical protein
MSTMRRRALPRSVAVAESREIARMLIETFDTSKDDHCDAGLSLSIGGTPLVEIGHHDEVGGVDGQLDCHELPIRTFDAIDALGCENGNLSCDELTKAFSYMPAADRRRLIDDLRDPYERTHHHWNRVGLPLLGGFLGIPVAGFLGMTSSTATGVAAGAVVAGFLANAAWHAFRSHVAAREIIALLDEAL